MSRIFNDSKISREIQIIQKRQKIIRDSKNINEIKKAVKFLKEKKLKDSGIAENVKQWIIVGDWKVILKNPEEEVLSDKKTMKNYIFNNPSLIAPDLKIIKREFDLNFCKVDALGQRSSGEYVFIEIKIGEVIGQTIGQLLTYIYAFKHYFGKDVDVILCAKSFHPQAIAVIEYLKSLKVNNIELRYLGGKKFDFNENRFERTRQKPMDIKNKRLWGKIRGK